MIAPNYFSMNYHPEMNPPRFQVWNAKFEINAIGFDSPDNESRNAISVTGWVDVPDTQKWHIHIITDEILPCAPQTSLWLKVPITEDKSLSGKFVTLRTDMQNDRYYIDYMSFGEIEID
jgi:hypothetical protein